MNRDTPYRPPTRSLNGIERRSAPTRAFVAPREAQSVVPSRPDFEARTATSAARVLEMEQHEADRVFANIESRFMEHQLQLSTASVNGATGTPVTLPTMGASNVHTSLTHFDSKPKKTKRTLELWVKYGIPIFAALLLVTGGIMAVISIQNNIALQEQVQTFTSDAEDSGETSQTNGVMPTSDVTDPRAPKFITIPSLNIAASMTVVGVNNKGNIGAPANIRQASWYKGSDSPVDTKGDAMIVAHVGTDRYPGAFAQLHEIKEGDTIRLTMGDDTQATYTVTESTDVAPEKMDVAQYTGKGSRHEGMYIHLVTCTGDYNARTKTYTHRLIVTARLLSVESKTAST